MPIFQKNRKTTLDKTKIRYPWSVYILRCADASLYTGITTDLALRLERHNQGTASKYTRSRRPVKIVWHESLHTESSARKREAQIKSWTRAEKRQLINAGKNAVKSVRGLRF